MYFSIMSTLICMATKSYLETSATAALIKMVSFLPRIKYTVHYTRYMQNIMVIILILHFYCLFLFFDSYVTDG